MTALALIDHIRGIVVKATRLGRLASRPAPFAGSTPGTTSGDVQDADLTVLIPAFQHERFIDDALRSVLVQSYQGFRILVVDDCSSDRTVERARAINDPRITVSVNDRNMGLGASVVAALDAVDTPFVALLNSDDLYQPDRLRLSRDALLGDAALRLVATGVELVDKAGSVLNADNASRLLDGLRIFHWVRWYDRVMGEMDADELPFLKLLRHNYLLTSSNIVCRTAFLREQASALKSLKYCLDWYLFLAAAADGRLGVIPDRLLGYRLHGSNTVWFDGAVWGAYAGEVEQVAMATVERRLNMMSADARPAALAEMQLCLLANEAIKPEGPSRGGRVQTNHPDTPGTQQPL